MVNVNFFGPDFTLTELRSTAKDVMTGSPGENVVLQTDGGVGMVAAWAGPGSTMTATTAAERTPTAKARRPR